MTITRELLRTWDACYHDKRIAELVPLEGVTLAQVLDSSIPDDDKVWIAMRALDRRTRCGVLATIIERALGRVADPDPRSLAVIPLLRRIAAGVIVTDAAIESAAQSACSAARSARSAWSAAWSAARSARSAWSAAWSVRSAVWSAWSAGSARPEEARQQVADIRDAIAESENCQNSLDITQAVE